MSGSATAPSIWRIRATDHSRLSRLFPVPHRDLETSSAARQFSCRTSRAPRNSPTPEYSSIWRTPSSKTPDWNTTKASAATTSWPRAAFRYSCSRPGRRAHRTGCPAQTHRLTTRRAPHTPSPAHYQVRRGGGVLARHGTPIATDLEPRHIPHSGPGETHRRTENDPRSRSAITDPTCSNAGQSAFRVRNDTDLSFHPRPSKA